MVNALSGVDPFQTSTVRLFMWKYNLLRNCSREEIDAVLAAFRRYWRAWRKKDAAAPPGRTLTRAEVRERFEDLFRRLHRAHSRNWISGTSKLLWCMHPHDIVIYDRFVHSALTTLQPLEPALRDLEQIGPNQSPEEAGTEGVVDHYMRAWDLVQALRSAYQEELATLRLQHSRASEYAWDIRVLDRLLVYLGNPSWEPASK